MQDLENVSKYNQKAGDEEDQPNASSREKDPCKQDTKNQSENDPYEQDRRAHISFDQIGSRFFFPGPSKHERQDSNGIAE